MSSRNTELSDALRTAAIDKIGRLDRYLDGMDRARIHFWHEHTKRSPQREVCEVTIEGRGRSVRSRAVAGHGQSAVDRAVDKLEQQLHKLKGKIVDRKHVGRRRGPSQRISLRYAEVTPTELEGFDLRFDDEIEGTEHHDEVRVGGDNRRIVRTRRAASKPMTPDEAVLQMDLSGSAFYFFTNSETDRAAVVYHRSGHEIGLMEDGD